MATIRIFPPSSERSSLPAGNNSVISPLPKLLHTPAGLALIEIQGTINHPSSNETTGQSIPIGRIEFPDYKAGDPSLGADGQGKWQKRAWLFVGEHQRLTGEVKKLSKPFGVLRKRSKGTAGGDAEMGGVENAGGEDLEITEVIRWKIVFSSRPEPVGIATEL